MTENPIGLTRKVIKPVSNFFSSPVAGGIVLIIASAAAIIVANSPLREGYETLMAVFFMMVGLEIKRELVTGQLATWSQRALPGFAALGGLAVPALIYVGFNAGHDETLSGWAIPAATDIAFALGVLALLGSRVPVSLKIFLSALAILDDMGAVAIIALFYTSNISLLMLGGAAAMVALLFSLNRAGVTRLLPYLLTGGVLWFFMLQSGVHATVAGILLAFFIPLLIGTGGNSGTQITSTLLSGMTADDLMSPVPVGVALGLFVGKQAGIFGLSLLAVSLGLAKRPEKSTWLQVYGVSVLCGIGFTMSLFIGNLAFTGSPLLVDEVKVGVLAGSILAALAGILILRFAPSKQVR